MLQAMHTVRMGPPDENPYIYYNLLHSPMVSYEETEKFLHVERGKKNSTGGGGRGGRGKNAGRGKGNEVEPNEKKRAAGRKGWETRREKEKREKERGKREEGEQSDE
jgi:hypothetical protein